jgi:mono/diheme cytochrome c family protein
MMRRSDLFCLALALVAVLGARASAQGDENIARRAQALLTDRCFRCHGPDESARKADLRFDRGPSLGDARTRAEMQRRLRTPDLEERMPPPEANLELSAEELALLERWLEDGAPTATHWAFRELAAPAVPAVREERWPAQELDRFVLAALEARGLAPQPAAEPELWLRRVSFDLTGLPPRAEQLAAIRADASDAQRARLVDELLAAPAAAEHMAARWLDLARYGDTFGYQSDVEMEVWPWRDWVLRAFQQNLPYDQFLTWQLAGDLLPDASDEQITATTFNRLHRQTNEGGSIDEEFRVEYVADRVATLGTAFLGLTLECARCHDHKVDPISQRDYYGLFAVFQNIDESGLYSHFTRATPTPTQWLYREGEREQHAALREEIEAAENALSEAEVLARIAGAARAPEPLALPTPAARFSFDAEENGARRFEGPECIAGFRGQALRFDGESGVGFGALGAIGRHEELSIALRVLPPARAKEKKVLLHRTRAGPDAGSRGYELTLEDGHLELRFTHFWPGNAIAVRTRERLPEGAWVHLAFAYDGSSRAEGLRIWIDGERAPLDLVRDHLTRDITYRSEWGDSTDVELTLAARFRDLGFVGGAIDELELYTQALTDLEAKALAEGATSIHTNANASSEGELALRAAHAAERSDATAAAARATLRTLRARENDLTHRVRELMVMREEPQPKPAHILRRGAYDQPGESVEPGFPSAIHPIDPALPKNRLGLARWLTDPRHPLTARVAANRLWMQMFGRGLCATPENFGLLGHEPEHTALLDHLASELVRSGWDQRALLRTIALSATYAQRSQAPAELLRDDPLNALLARGRSRPLSAEELRDTALAASGLLVAKLGGPSVKPYQPAGLWEDAGTGKHYAQDHGESLYRRSLYTFWRRTMPPASLSCFDAPSREVARARREPTQTPLQALVLLNDPQMVEAARVLAEDLLTRAADDEQRLTLLFERLLTRAPGERERAALRRLLARERAHYAERPEQAEALRKIGESAARAELEAREVAAWAVVVQAVVNHAELRMSR